MSSSLRTSQVPPVAGEEMISEVVVALPPGVLGVCFQKGSCPPRVSAIMDTCPFADKIKVGDTISSLILPNNTTLSNLTSTVLVETLVQHKESSGRKLVVATNVPTTEKVGGVEIPLADATEVSSRPLPGREPFTQHNLLQVLVLVFTLLAFFLSVAGTASCQYLNVGVNGLNNFVGSGANFWDDDYSSYGSQSVGSSSLGLSAGLFRSQALGVCVKNPHPGSDNIVLYFAQVGAVISCILAGIAVCFFTWALFDHTKWFRKCNHVLLNFAFSGALLSFTMFATCACGVCTGADAFAANAQNLFSCTPASGANLFIAASICYLSTSIMLCCTQAPTAPLINCGNCSQ